ILLVVNAVNTEKIFGHLRNVAPKGIEVTNLTDRVGQIAVQGPRSRELLLASDLCSPVRDTLAELGYYHFITFDRKGSEIILSRTGYTGELGYEIYLPGDQSLEVWNEFLDCGGQMGVGPIGLGARDTLRFEASYCLYGHELSEDISPLEAGLSWVVKLKKNDFIGQSALVAEKEAGPARKLVGFEIEGRKIARQGYRVISGDRDVGEVTSGTFAPTLKKSLSMALVLSSVPDDEDDLAVDIRDKYVPVRRVKLPFYKGTIKD
ncbi:MAG: glycine cleavage system aminomethyltransferase GcvT, partial [Candidatus Krumholzibacteria bacterium]|nr:glycine cleavage system aminomethyltransferase GcvT [Candidatus Krumholzibacteria bacterium]